MKHHNFQSSQPAKQGLKATLQQQLTPILGVLDCYLFIQFRLVMTFDRSWHAAQLQHQRSTKEEKREHDCEPGQE